MTDSRVETEHSAVLATCVVPRCRRLPALPKPTPVSIRYPAGLSRPIPPSTLEGSGSTSQLGATNGTSTNNHYPPTFTTPSTSPSVGWPTTRPREKKVNMPHHLSPLFFPALFVSAKVLQSYETDGLIIHLAVREAPQGNPFLFGHGSPRPPPSSQRPSPSTRRHSSSRTRPCGLCMHRQKHVESADPYNRGSIHCCPATLKACELVGYLLTAVSNKQRRFACRVCNSGPAATATLFLLHGDNRVRANDLRTWSLASVSQRPSLPVSQSGGSGTSPFHDGQERMDISLTSDVTPRKSQGVRPRG